MDVSLTLLTKSREVGVPPMPREEPDVSEVPGFGWRVSLSIIAAVGWLIFLIIWLFFYASGYNVYQNLAIIMVSVVAIAVIESLLWKPMWWELGKPHAEEELCSLLLEVQ